MTQEFVFKKNALEFSKNLEASWLWSKPQFKFVRRPDVEGKENSRISMKVADKTVEGFEIPDFISQTGLHQSILMDIRGNLIQLKQDFKPGKLWAQQEILSLRGVSLQ